MLSFGVTVLPDPPYQRMVELMQLGERQGFEYAWTYDSHILWQESYATLALAADRTERIKLGHFVTNPGIRDPTITASWYATMQDISNGRMALGIGRGDSSRRVVGLKPVKVADFEARCRSWASNAVVASETQARQMVTGLSPPPWRSWPTSAWGRRQ